MYDKTLIVIIILIIGFVLLNLNTSVVEGLKNPFNSKNIKKSFNKAVKKASDAVKKNADAAKKKSDDFFKKDSKKSSSDDDNAAETNSLSVATAATAATTAATATAAAVEPIQTINDVAQAPLPVDFKEVQGYLEKIKNYSSDAQTMSTSIRGSVEEYKRAYDEASNNLSRLFDATKSNADSTKTIAEETLRQMDAIQRDISTKAVDIQAQVNSNNIVKNEIGARMNEMRDIKEKVSDIFIDVKKSEMNAAQSAEEARKSLASILPTAANNTVLQSVGSQSGGAQSGSDRSGGAQSGSDQSGKSVEGFTGFKTSILEGYTVYSDPYLPNGNMINRNAFDLENDLVNKINLFNTAYYTVLSQKNPTNTQKTALTNARTNLDTAIAGLNTHITSIGGATPKISDAVFDASQAYIKTTASQIDTLRSDLDMKMLEILKAKQGTPMDHTINHDTAAYTTILWTALATSALYFIFVKIE